MRDEESRIVEEAYLKSLRLFELPKDENHKKDAGLFCFGIHNTIYSGEPGTLTERIEQPEPEYVWVEFDSSLIRCFYGDNSTDFDGVLDVVKTVDCFGLETARKLAREIWCYMRSCYYVDNRVYWSIDPVTLSKKDCDLMLTVDIHRTVASVDYLEVKSKTNLDEPPAIIMEDDHECCDDDGMDPNKAHDDNMTKVDAKSNDMDDDGDDEEEPHVDYDDMHVGYDDDDNDGMDMVDGESNDMHVGNVDDDDDEEPHVDYDMDDDDDDSYDDFETDSPKYEISEIYWCVKEWKERKGESPLKIITQEAKPWVIIEEMELGYMGSGNYKPLIENTNYAKLDDTECPICLTGFSQNVESSNIFPWLPKPNSWCIVRLGCRHIFHHECIFKWLPKTPSCPLCRSISLAGI